MEYLVSTFKSDPIALVSLILSGAAIAFAAYVHWNQRKLQKHLNTRDFNSAWQGFNQTLVSNDAFVGFERVAHPYGELSEEDVKRLYFYFMRFNVAYSAFIGDKQLRSKLAESALKNEINVSFKDREFIKRHVFRRGYDSDFAEKFIAGWEKIETTGDPLPMRGYSND